jgi:SAM-dependent methyltransferase
MLNPAGLTDRQPADGAGAPAGPRPLDRSEAAAAAGGRTLEAFTQTPRINRWIYGQFSGVGGEVLETGSGIGTLSRLIRDDAARLLLTEVEPAYLDALAERYRGDPAVEVMPWDLTEPPPAALLGRRFDAVVSVNVIEHLPDDRAAVQALVELLKPGGTLFVYVPGCPFAFGSLDLALGHHRRYTRRSLAALLSGAGLELADGGPRYMNRLGLLGWLISGRVLRRRVLSGPLIGLFERMIWLARALDRLTAPLPVGLGLVVQARKPPPRP